MKLAIMQPYFLPYIGYFQLINAVDKYVIYDDVNHIKRGWVHRNKININGVDSWLGLSLQKASQNKKINEIKLDPDNKWKEKLLKKIEMNFCKKPFFDDTYPIIKNAIDSDYEYMWQILSKSIIDICEHLDIDTKICLSSHITSNQELKKEERILDICKQLEVPIYINAINGQKLYNKEMFASCGVELKFIKMEDLGLQNNYASILEVLMHNGKDETKKLLKNYTLV